MSPEQIQGGRLDPRCDVWSVGVLLFELVCGRRPFERQLPGEEVAAILAGAHPSLAEEDPRVSRQLAALCRDCLASDPERRPADADGLRARLSELPELRTVAELAGLCRDRAALLETLSAGQAELWRTEAERALAAGESFLGLDAVDRALAYRPDQQPALRGLIDRAIGQRDRRAPARRRRLKAALLVGLSLLLLAAAFGVGVWLLPRAPVSAGVRAAPAAPPAPIVAQPRNSKRSAAAERSFYQSAAGLVGIMSDGARRRLAASPGKRDERQRAADDAALQIVEGMGGLFADVGSGAEHAPGADVSPAGQEAAARMLGGLVKLVAAGVKAPGQPPARKR